MEMKLLLLALMVFQNLAIFAVSDVADDKTYYNRHPHTPSAPKVSTNPPHSSGSGYGTPKHSSGTKSPVANCGTPPKKSSSSSHHGGYYNTPPTSSTPPISTLPPSVPTPSTPTPFVPTPSTPTPSVPTPSTPTPSVPTPSTPTPIDPNNPPITSTPPAVTTPTLPPIINPTPPFGIFPAPFPCTFWRNSPTLVWGLVSQFGTLGNAFGLPNNVPGVPNFPGFPNAPGVPNAPGFGVNANVLQALSNTRNDGYGELFREGSAALLNTLAHRRFPYTLNQVRSSFLSALVSNQAAAAQARIFKMANEGRIKA